MIMTAAKSIDTLKEVKKVKGKVILLSSIVLLMLFAVAPAMACTNACTSPRCVPATNHAIAYISDTPGYTITTPSGIVFTYGEKVTLTGIVTIGSAQYNNYGVFTEYSIYNPNTGTITVNMPNTVWYFGTGTGVSHNGFMGCVVVTVYNANSATPTAFVHADLHGFGSFAGQTLKFDTNNPVFWTGYCIIR